MALTREQQRAMFANLAKRKSVTVGILKPLGKGTETKPSTFTVIPLGAGNPENKNFGLPIFTIARDEALRIRKENMFRPQTEAGRLTGHLGEFPVEDFKRLVEKDPKAFSQTKKAEAKQEVKKRIEEEAGDQGEGDPHQVPQTILEQLQASRVNGFPFFAFTGIKGFIKEKKALTLVKIPRSPNRIKKVKIVYDEGRDLYNIIFFKEKKQVPFISNRIDGIFFNQLSDLIVDEMGVR